MAVSPAISMYRLPTYYNDQAVPLPECMYNLPSYFQSNSDATESVSSLQNLERRQEDILCELNGLRAAVEQMASSLGVSLPRERVKTTPSTQDLVISASLTDPPVIISTLQHIMKQRGLIHSTASFVHSSVQGPMPEHVKTRFQNFCSSSKGIGRAPVILTIVWKKEKDLPYLVASPCSHTPLIGEITIARFLCRGLLPDLYGNLMPEESAIVDSWIDQVLASSKERMGAIKSLEAKLGRHQWILGSKMSLADVVLGSCIVKEHGDKSVSENVNKWLRRIPGLITN